MARPIEESLRILAVHVRERAALPALVVVSSAQPGDGGTYVSCGLARACAEHGMRTLLLDAQPEGPGVAEELDDDRAAGLTVAALSHQDTRTRLDDRGLAALLEHARDRFEMTVVDAPPIPTSSIAVRLARASDGVLLAVRLGRRPSDADAETIQLVGNGSAPLLGVVPTRVRRRRDGAPQREKLLPFERPKQPQVTPARVVLRW